jgi:hypothetical protein
MRSFALVALALAAACGGTSSSSGGTGPAPAGDRLPWEASLTTGASFTLAADTEGLGDGEDYPDLTIKVTSVEDKGTERVYTLDWGDELGGPSKIVVRGAQVLVGEAEAAAMQEPWEMPGGVWCYAEDFSNPDGCEDVCDAALCLAAGSGIVSASGLYTPGYMSYAAK